MLWKSTKRIYMWYLHIRRHFNDVIFFSDAKTIIGDMLILIFYPLRLNLVHFRMKLTNKMQESPDRHRLQWTYRLNCTDTMYVSLMTS